jgi:hypothetical protein
MLDHKHKTIFVHVPKAAGQSVEKVFIERNGLTWSDRAPLLLRENDNPAIGPERLAHLTAAEYYELGHVSREEFGRLYKFAFVRNPWSRLVSAYVYRDIEYDMTFAQFAEEFLSLSDPMDIHYRHAMPQIAYLEDASGNMLVDFVGRFENIAEDFRKVTEELGLGPLELPHKNKSTQFGIFLRGKKSYLIRKGKQLVKSRKEQRHSHYSLYYDAKTLDLATDYYRRDIEAFGYEFEDRR